MGYLIEFTCCNFHTWRREFDVIDFKELLNVLCPICSDEANKIESLEYGLNVNLKERIVIPAGRRISIVGFNFQNSSNSVSTRVDSKQRDLVMGKVQEIKAYVQALLEQRRIGEVTKVQLNVLLDELASEIVDELKIKSKDKAAIEARLDREKLEHLRSGIQKIIRMIGEGEYSFSASTELVNMLGVLLRNSKHIRETHKSVIENENKEGKKEVDIEKKKKKIKRIIVRKNGR